MSVKNQKFVLWVLQTGTNFWFGTLVALCAFVAGVGSVAALTGQRASSGDQPFPGLQLGMSTTSALSVMRSLDAAAFEGPVCNGADGIAATVTHLGMTWQLKAHKKAGKIDEVILERHSRNGTATAASCRATFEKRVVPFYSRKHEAATWQKTDEDFGLYLLNTTQTPKASFVAVHAGRLNRPDALCTYRIVYR